MCQFQNQRVSLTVRFQTFSDSRRTLFALIVLLIDNSDERIIHSYQQLTYVYIQRCQVKFNMYLLYATRPKNSTNQYSIHIDIYEKISLIYRGSLSIPVNYPFLPVNRVAVQLNIPRNADTDKRCSDQPCSHGQCIKYSDDSKETSFCRCEQGWSGKYCTIQRPCQCSDDSLCIGISANNRSICICPLNKWSSLCLLHSTGCQSNQNVTCENDGQCISVHDDITSIVERYLCICSKGFSGKICEIIDNKIIVLPQSILFHYIRVLDDGPPENGSSFKTISINERVITILWSRPFHVVFAELFNRDYYLIAVQKTYNRSLVISTTIYPSDRCPHISEVLNDSIVNLHLLRRIKYYHLPCHPNRSSPLACFYDRDHFCLCTDFGHQRIANYFEFHSSIKHDYCFGQSNCENEAQCLQDRS